MKTEFILVLAILVLAAPVDAKPEKITIRPCNVSFDMGKVGAHSIISEQSENKNLAGVPYTKYHATIKGKESIESN